jgi:hypothetical protein
MQAPTHSLKYLIRIKVQLGGAEKLVNVDPENLILYRKTDD